MYIRSTLYQSREKVTYKITLLQLLKLNKPNLNILAPKPAILPLQLNLNVQKEDSFVRKSNQFLRRIVSCCLCFNKLATNKLPRESQKIQEHQKFIYFLRRTHLLFFKRNLVSSQAFFQTWFFVTLSIFVLLLQ